GLSPARESVQIPRSVDMVPVGQPYQSSGEFEIRGVLSMLILGALTAAIAAGIVWLWEISPIPTLLILTPLLQGALLAVVLAALVSRLRFRNAFLATAIGFACGLLSIGLVHYGHYLSLVSSMRAALMENVQNDKDLTEEERKKILAQVEENPNRLVD